MGITEEMARWLKRLPLAEQMQLERARQQSDGMLKARTGTRCSCCGRKGIAEGDPLKRCPACVLRRRNPSRLGSRDEGGGRARHVD